MSSDRIEHHKRVNDGRELARPLGVQRTVGGLARVLWWRARRRWTSGWVVYVLVLAGQIVLAIVASPWYDATIIAWLMAGSVGLLVASVAEADLESRRSLWRRATTPSVGNYRLIDDFGGVEPTALLLVDLVAFLHAEARIVRRPIRGHPNGGARSTYAVGLRDLARKWAATRGIPLRRGDALARQLLALGVIGEVAVGQAKAWRLAFSTVDDALRALEGSLCVSLIDWHVGRDPDSA